MNREDEEARIARDLEVAMASANSVIRAAAMTALNLEKTRALGMTATNELLKEELARVKAELAVFAPHNQEGEDVRVARRLSNTVKAARGYKQDADGPTVTVQCVYFGEPGKSPLLWSATCARFEGRGRTVIEAIDTCIETALLSVSRVASDADELRIAALKAAGGVE